MNNLDIDIWLYDVGGKISNYGVLSAKELQEKAMIFFEVKKNIEKLDKNDPKVKKIIVASFIYKKAESLYAAYAMAQALNKMGYRTDMDKERILENYNTAKKIYEYDKIETRNVVNKILKENNMTVDGIHQTVEKFSRFIDELHRRYIRDYSDQDIGSFVETLILGENNLKKSASKR